MANVNINDHDIISSLVSRYLDCATVVYGCHSNEPNSQHLSDRVTTPSFSSLQSSDVSYAD